MLPISLESVHRQIRNCDLCGLHKHVRQPVPGEGPSTAEIMFVGEGLGKQDGLIGRPFQGQTGQLLTKLLREAGIDKDTMYLSNVLKCWPKALDDSGKDNRPPKAAEIKTCAPHLADELSFVKPKLIIAAGSIPLKYFLGRSYNITSQRGSIVPLPEYDAHLLSIFHPASIVHHPEHHQITVDDLKRGKHFLENGGELPKKKPTEYKWLTDHNEILSFLKFLQGQPAFSYDIETTGFDFTAGADKLLSIAFSWEEGKASCFLLDHDNLAKILYYPELVKLFAGKGVKIAQNGKFDNKFLKTAGIEVKAPTFDTLLAHHLLNENAQGMHGLKALAWEYTDMGGYDKDLDEAFKEIKKSKGSSANYGHLPKDLLVRYNNADADCTFRLYPIFKKQLADQNLKKLFTSITMPLARALTDVEYFGTQIDVPYLDKLSANYSAKLSHLETELRGKIGDVNLNSPKQLQNLLFNTLGLNPISLTASGAPSTDEESLTALSKRHEVPSLILNYRKAKKVNSTYIVGMRKLLDSNDHIHTTFKIHGTQTGRLSSAAPNLQNIPHTEELRNLFIARPGYTLIQSDYSAAEFKAWAHYAQDAVMIKDIVDGVDIHKKVASQVYSITIPEVTSDQRRSAKLVVFGLMYGRGANSVAKQFGFTKAMANKIIQTFFRMYPKASKWLTQTELEVKRQGYLINFFGRVRRLPGAFSVLDKLRAEALRQSRNFPIQSLVADLTNFALARLHEELIANQYDARIVLQVHDALIVEVHESQLDVVAPLVRAEMTKHIKGLRVPFDVELKVGKKWGSMKVVDFATTT